MGHLSCRFIFALLLLVTLGFGNARAADPPEAQRVAELTLEEKASLATGRNAWETFEIEGADDLTFGSVGFEFRF